MPTELPLIVQRMFYAAERIERVIKGEDVAVLVFGPTGTGKTQLVIDLCRKHGVIPIFCRDMTKPGFREMIRKHRVGRRLIVIDDSDEFLHDIEFCNLMKQVAVNERRRTIPR
jgi:predicted AAA+ superfamily ATPase